MDDKNSIFLSIKNLIVSDPEDDSFDGDILLHINSAIGSLSQLTNLVPKNFVVTGETETWSELVNQKIYSQVNMIKTYIYLKVKKVFDPQTSSVLMQAYNEELKEIEFRICDLDIFNSD